VSFHEQFREMKRSGDFSHLPEAVPYAHFMGITVAETAGRMLTTMDFDEKLVGNISLQAIHGGALAALLELAALFQISYEIDTEQMPRVITITIDYMRSGGAKKTFARAHATRVGRRVANVVAQAWQDDPAKPIASANVNFLLS